MRRKMRLAEHGLPVVSLLAVAMAWPAVARSEAPPARRRAPHAGYVYPAGGRVGTTFTATVGGQYLRGARGVHVSGKGVRARILYYLPPPRPLDRKQALVLKRRLLELRDRKLAAGGGKGRGRRSAAAGSARGGARPAKQKDARKPGVEVALPEHPLLENLESKSVEELLEVARYFLRRKNPLQRKRAIEESVRLEVTVDSDAELGPRELRVLTPSGLTNPLQFRVGALPEARESGRQEWWAVGAGIDRGAGPPALERPAGLPVVFNGQILPRDVDRFRFRARQGQRLVVRAEARGLIPYQADAVPGWLQATLTLHDAQGREVAYADEYRDDPDPVLFFEVPRDGVYTLEVRDAISRGREDFVYRITAGELPFVTGLFPLGGQAGKRSMAEIEGWNLRRRRVPLDTVEGPPSIRRSAWRQGEAMTNDVPYWVSSSPSRLESEPNDDADRASRLDLPSLVDGRIGKPGDRDAFRFEGRQGDVVVAEVIARRVGSPLDSVLKLLDGGGKVVAWNDDHAAEVAGLRSLGLLTHHADSYLRAELPESGAYTLFVSDAGRHGGAEYAYRLRVGPPRPDVELFAAPSSLALPAGRAGEITLFALRKDGFEGDVEISLVDSPEGFSLGGARVPAGRSRVRMTLTAPREGAARPISLRLRGRIRVGEKSIERPVTPADDRMQAFLWRHLVPARELVVAVIGAGGRWVPTVELAEDLPVRIPVGGRTRVRFALSGRFPRDAYRFQLLDPPEGVTLGGSELTSDGLGLELRASAAAGPAARTDNLIVEVIAKPRGNGAKRGRKGAKSAKGKRAGPKRAFSVGLLPAVPFVIERP